MQIIVRQFSRQPRKLGRGSGLKINDVFWSIFMNNAAFFSAGVYMLLMALAGYYIKVLDEHLPLAVELAARYPRQPFVLDHIGKPPFCDGGLEPWATDLRRLVSCLEIASQLERMGDHAQHVAREIAQVGAFPSRP